MGKLQMIVRTSVHSPVLYHSVVIKDAFETDQPSRTVSFQSALERDSEELLGKLLGSSYSNFPFCFIGANLHFSDLAVM